LKWDKEKDAYLKELCPSGHLSDRDIAERFQKRYHQQVTAKAIENRRLKIGLKKVYFNDNLDISQNVKVSSENKLDDNSETVLGWLQKEELSIGEISRRLDKSKETVIKILDKLKSKGYEVDLDYERHQIRLQKELKRQFKPTKIEHLYRDTCKIGLISDSHLCSKFQQITLLHTAYKIMEKEKVNFAIHTGDLGDGDGHLYTGQVYEQFAVGIDEMCNYVVENYPKTSKFKTYIISGNHDLSFLKHFGFNFVKAVCREREDLVYRGDVGTKFQVKNVIIEALHPSGGIPYARSYRMQKVIEGLVGDILMQVKKNPQTPIPQIYLAGHLHISMFLPYISLQAYAVPCFQAQTPYLKAKGAYPQVGFWIIEVFLDKNKNVGIVRNKYYDFTGEILENDY